MGLGDCLIALAAVRALPGSHTFACHSKWIPLLSSLIPGSDLRFLPVDLPYTTRQGSGLFDISGAPIYRNLSETDLYCVRGNLREFLIAQYVFPEMKHHLTGWRESFARRFSIYDKYLQWRGVGPRNRYLLWAETLDVPFETIAEIYREKKNSRSGKGVGIHIGAQWRSRQYPHVKELRSLLQSRGVDVKIFGGPGDQAPEGLSDSDIIRVLGTDLVKEFEKLDLAITNDSGPMHLSAFLGVKTLAIARISNIVEWLPPLARAVQSPLMPTGVRADSAYTSDQVVSGWPSPEEIVQTL